MKNSKYYRFLLSIVSLVVLAGLFQVQPIFANSVVPPIMMLLLGNCMNDSNKVTINANTVNPETVIAGAGENSTVWVDGSLGTVVASGDIILNECQKIAGSDNSHPTIEGSIVMAPGSIVSGLTIEGKGTTAAVEVRGKGTFQILDNVISNADNGNENLVVLDAREPDFDIAEAGIFGNGFSGKLIIADTTVGTPVNVLILAPADGYITINDSAFSTTTSYGGNFYTFGNASVDASFLRSTFNTQDNSFNNLITYDNSTLTLNFVDTDTTSASDVFNNFQSQNQSTLMATFSNCDLLATGTGEVFNNLEAKGDSRMTIEFNNNSTLTTTATRVINNLESEDNASLVATFIDSTIASAQDAINNMKSLGNSNLLATFTESTITAGDGYEAIRNLKSLGTSELVATFTSNTISAPADAIVGATFDTSTACVNFTNNTLTSGGGFFDFNLTHNSGSTFNVVDFNNLSSNNNSASVTTSGTITDVVACS